MKLILPQPSLLLLLIMGGTEISYGDSVSSQLMDWRNSQVGPSIATDQRGCPLPSLTSSLSVGPRGPILLQDTNLLNHLAHFSRERIPERVVHANGAGAFGYFEVTHDITKYTKAKIFSQIGKRTPVATRFSSNFGERGSTDTGRSARGMALKFQTEDGTFDILNSSFEAFFLEDPILFPSMTHSFKRNPQTGLMDYNMFWDFLSLRPESTLATMLLMGDQGIPDGYRHMDSFAINAFKMVNSADKPVYVKFHWTTNQGVKFLNTTVGIILTGEDSNYAKRDLYNAITDNNFPSWRLWIQVMTFAEARAYKWNPFDATKTWLKKDFPLIPVGKLVLHQNPINYHADVEQIAFSPGNLIPGIEASPDRLLQGRFFTYPDTARHRLGANFLHLPINFPVKTLINTYVRDGPGSIGGNEGATPNYFPNSFNGPFVDESIAHETGYNLQPADVVRSDSGKDHYSQATIYWNELISDGEKRRIVENIAGLLRLVTDEAIRTRAISNFANVAVQFRSMLVDSLRDIL